MRYRALAAFVGSSVGTAKPSTVAVTGTSNVGTSFPTTSLRPPCEVSDGDPTHTTTVPPSCPLHFVFCSFAASVRALSTFGFAVAAL